MHFNVQPYDTRKHVTSFAGRIFIRFKLMYMKIILMYIMWTIYTFYNQHRDVTGALAYVLMLETIPDFSFPSSYIPPYGTAHASVIG
jgi:hypothetical protein